MKMYLNSLDLYGIKYRNRGITDDMLALIYGNKMKNKYSIGDPVQKISGDYAFYGRIVSVFEKRGGLLRYVVENKDGMLFIFNEAQLNECPALNTIERCD